MIARYYILADDGQIWNHRRRVWQWFHDSSSQAYFADDSDGSRTAVKRSQTLMRQYGMQMIRVVHEDNLDEYRSPQPWGSLETHRRVSA